MFLKITGYFKEIKFVLKKSISNVDCMDFSKEHKFELNGQSVHHFLFKVQLKKPYPMCNSSKVAVEFN